MRKKSADLKKKNNEKKKPKVSIKRRRAFRERGRKKETSEANSN